MTPRRILETNALFTFVSAAATLALRSTLHPLFGLDTPFVLDLVAIALMAYVPLLIVAARRQPIERQTLMAFALADAAWVMGSAVVLVLFWAELTPIARMLVIVAALAVEAFAALQYRAAGRAVSGREQIRSAT
jgi:uncharacterized membrane protein YdbT with pleckstrin-like domain